MIIPQSNKVVKLENSTTSLFSCRASAAKGIMIMIQSNEFAKLGNLTTSLSPVGQVLPKEL